MEREICYNLANIYNVEKQNGLKNHIFSSFEFDIYSSIGMICMVGTDKLPESAVMWQSKERVGLIRSSIIETVDIILIRRCKFHIRRLRLLIGFGS